MYNTNDSIRTGNALSYNMAAMRGGGGMGTAVVAPVTQTESITGTAVVIATVVSIGIIGGIGYLGYKVGEAVAPSKAKEKKYAWAGAGIAVIGPALVGAAFR